MDRRPPKATLPAQVTLDASGGGEVTITARAPLLVRHVRVTVGLAPGNTAIVRQPTATTYVGDHEFESTSAGARDQSDTQFELEATETIRCVWSGGDAGATASIYVRGVWL